MLDNVTKEEEKVLLQSLVNDLINDSRLNEWEREFLASVNKQLVYKDLSERQLTTLNKIKQKCAPEGS
ncbi:MAG: hypothetical protein QMD97_02515 [Candidatus Aenigmarchaeota archaeon]|nr:hypothetical protein [Candidatus Aenigmarchaeota archaeon]